MVLSERGLPTGALTGELFEHVISVGYIAAGDSYAHRTNDIVPRIGSADRTKWRSASAERARLCRDYLWIQRTREVRARLQAHDGLTVDELSHGDTFVAAGVIGQDRVEDMEHCKDTWAGCSVAEMAAQATLPDELRDSMLAYLNSRAVHGLDAADWAELVGGADGEAIALKVPERVEWHVLLACADTLVALEIVGGSFGVDRQVELAGLHAEIETLWRSLPG